MKHLFIILMGLLGLSEHKAQDNIHQNDLQKEKINGKVKSITTTTYMLFGPNVFYREPDRVIIQYNEQGNKTEKAEYDKGKFSHKIFYEYNPMGKNINQKIYDINGKLDYEATFDYDDRNHLIQEIGYNRDRDIVIKYIYEYDEKGNRTTFHRYTSYSKETFIYLYDENGNKIEQKKL